MSRPVKVAIAEDHEIFREGFRLLLAQLPQVEFVAEAENGVQFIEQIKQHPPDVAFLDIRMPVMDGIKTCAEIKKILPEVKVIALSMFNDEHLLIDMLEAGASGYLLKNTTRGEILAAIKAVQEGESYYCSSSSQKLKKLLAEKKFSTDKSFHTIKLTQREKEVAKLICQELTNKEIADRLSLSTRTVESHRLSLFEKTGTKNMAGLVIYAIKHGIFSVEDSTSV
jgi:DNA-binding NarL/FixJ family response regulator